MDGRIVRGEEVVGSRTMTLEELGQQFLHPDEGVKLEVSGELRFDNGR